jgi:hypothetical protein
MQIYKPFICIKGGGMPRSILDRFTEEERRQLIERLLTIQAGKSYISGKEIDLRIDQVEVDHIIALDRGGDDDESNWGVVIASENSSKGKRDLQLLKYIYEFRSHRDKYLELKRDFTFGDALAEVYSSREDVIYDLSEKTITIKYNYKGERLVITYPILNDSLDKSVKSFVGMVPFEIINHDSSINPRSIADLEVMIEEFYNKNPQLFPSLAILDAISSDKGKIMVFDGQHKAAAQLYLRSKMLFLRVFVNIEKPKIKKTNLRAHTVVAQIHFPKLIEDKVGHDLFSVEFEPYTDKVDHTKASELAFIKQDEINDEYRNYLGNYYKYNALIDEDGERHAILDYVETISARSKNYPVSYDTLSKTFLRLIYLKPSDEKLEKSIQLRRFEICNLRAIMSLFVNRVLKDKFDVQTGIYKIEEKLIDEPNSVADDHLIGYRICRQAAFLVWITEFRKAVARLLVSRNRYANAKWRDDRFLWADIRSEDFQIIANMFDVITRHRIWRIKENKEILSSLGSTKQSDWKSMLLDGKLPGREDRLFDPLNDTVIYDKAINYGPHGG